MAIFAHEPMEVKMSDGMISHTVCTCFRNGDKTISISMDNSLGRMTFLSRSDMRLFVKDAEGKEQEVTEKVFTDSGWNVPADLDTFQKAWDWLKA